MKTKNILVKKMKSEKKSLWIQKKGQKTNIKFMNLKKFKKIKQILLKKKIKKVLKTKKKPKHPKKVKK